MTVFVGQIDGDRQLRNLFIHDVRGRTQATVLSDTGLHRLDPVTGDHEVTLLDGRRYDGTPGAADYGIGSFQRYRLRIPAKDQGGPVSRKRSTIPTSDLWGSETLADRAELEHRLSGPVAIFSLALIAVPLSATSPRQRSTGRMVLAFLTYFGFFNLQRVAEGWMEAGGNPRLAWQPLVPGVHPGSGVPDPAFRQLLVSSSDTAPLPAAGGGSGVCDRGVRALTMSPGGDYRPCAMREGGPGRNRADSAEGPIAPPRT